MCAALYLCACEPAAYENFIYEKMVTRGGLRKLIAPLSSIAEKEGIRELRELMAAITERRRPDENLSAEICAGIEKLLAAEPRGLAHTPRLAGSRPDPSRVGIHAGKYTFIGGEHDMLVRVSDGEKWEYIDRSGNAVISDGFIYAEDFSDWRAVVETEGGFGLIDIDGRYVIAPRYDDIEWDGANNVCVATVEGMSGLFSRDGKPLTGLLYDQIINSGEELLLVKKGDLFGYIRRDGSVAIEPAYDDAFGFCGGRARVRKADREFEIDASGNPVRKVG